MAVSAVKQKSIATTSPLAARHEGCAQQRPAPAGWHNRLRCDEVTIEEWAVTDLDAMTPMSAREPKIAASQISFAAKALRISCGGSSAFECLDSEQQ